MAFPFQVSGRAFRGPHRTVENGRVVKTSERHDVFFRSRIRRINAEYEADCIEEWETKKRQRQVRR